ncbi:MAG: hypothetical protein K9M80_01815 [Candidatus Marinimicrobia bacterium]|nr:hypothetical protein [Candidatus Neomarinimicrobiota bacterium]
MNWINMVLSKIRDFITNDLFISDKEELLYRKNLMKIDQAEYLLDELRNLYNTGNKIINFNKFKDFELYTPHHIADGVMVSVFHKGDDVIYMTSHYAPNTELKFHAHSDAKETILHVRGKGRALIEDQEGISKTIELKEFEKIELDANVKHCWILDTNAISLVKLKKTT